jgi:tRNA(Ile)-lysidine synthase
VSRISALFTHHLNLLLPDPPSSLAVACSGGADSMALTLLLQEWCAPRGITLQALICEHGLRADSAAEAQRVQTRLAQQGIAATILPLQLTATSAIQEQARDARYAALTGWCLAHDICCLFTGHHADDQAETLLFRLLRHSGPDGLAGMSVVRRLHGVRLLRPLLGMRKPELITYLQTRGIAWEEDPSNHDQRFSRIRLRRLLATQPEHLQQQLHQLVRRFGEVRIRQEALLTQALQRYVRPQETGLWLDQALFSQAPFLAEAILKRCLMHVAASTQQPRRPDLQRLAEHLAQPGSPARTLHRCLLRPEKGGWTILPQPRPLEAAADVSHMNRVEKTGALRQVKPDVPPLWPEPFILPAAGVEETACRT